MAIPSPLADDSTHCIHDIERGLVPEWVDQPAPKIAIVSSCAAKRETRH